MAATDLAATLASSVDLPIANNVANQAISVSAKNEFSSDNEDVISKPTTVQSTASYEIVTYTAKAGDTADSIAAQFNLQKNSVKWSNNLQSDAIEPGRQLVIPPVDGIVAVAQAGDSADSLAQKYNTSPDRINLFNDGDFAAGKQVVVPGGSITIAPPQPPVRSSSTVNTTFTNAAVSVAGGNRYDYGYCTWYGYNRRMELGLPIGGMWGNASSWASLARAAGFRVDRTPEVGAVIQTANAAGGYGHVGVVESVGADGSVTISEMNYAGWNRKSTRTLSVEEAASYNYIH